MAQWDDQIDKLKQIIEIMKEHNLVEVQIKQGDDEICVKKGHPGVPGQPQIIGVPAVMVGAAAPGTPSAQAPAAEQEKLVEIKSPLVGTFYAQASPDSEPYVESGSRVDSQTVVCIIEAMKVMNEIKAEVSGTVVEVVAVSGEAVEYGQVLFRVRPD
jgi:acetyl-CoA carboxylase biotin carboxyl carrier protein